MENVGRVGVESEMEWELTPESVSNIETLFMGGDGRSEATVGFVNALESVKESDQVMQELAATSVQFVNSDRKSTEQLILKCLVIVGALGEGKSREMLLDGTINKQIELLMALEVERSQIWSDNKMTRYLSPLGGVKFCAAKHQFRLTANYLHNTRDVRNNQVERGKINNNSKRRIESRYKTVASSLAKLIGDPVTWTKINEQKKAVSALVATHSDDGNSNAVTIQSAAPLVVHVLSEAECLQTLLNVAAEDAMDIRQSIIGSKRPRDGFSSEHGKRNKVLCRLIIV
jgi:hypothetical protein